MSEEQVQLKKALKKIADHLSRRSHSEEELRLKLSKTFSAHLIETALEQAKQNRWLESESELSEKVVAGLHQKNKSWSYIKNYLYEKKLPLPPYDRETELTKAKNLLVKKCNDFKDSSPEQKIKLKQFLAYRGFEEDIMAELLE